MMLKIGEFSRLAQVSVRMLRHYDKLRLLRPKHVDDDSSYRYYAPEQLVEINRLLALKDLGFSLEEIGRFLGGGLTPEQVIEMLKQRRTELHQQLADGQARLRRVETRLSELDVHEVTSSPYVVVFKRVEPVYVASVRAILPNYGDGTILWSAITPFLQQHRIPYGAGHIYLYHDPEYRETQIDTELAVPVTGNIKASGQIVVAHLPDLECVATTIYRGDIDEVWGAYKALGTWITANGYRICGPNRLVVLHRGSDSHEHVTEVQWPVRRE